MYLSKRQKNFSVLSMSQALHGLLIGSLDIYFEGGKKPFLLSKFSNVVHSAVIFRSVRFPKITKQGKKKRKKAQLRFLALEAYTKTGLCNLSSA